MKMQLNRSVSFKLIICLFFLTAFHARAVNYVHTFTGKVKSIEIANDDISFYTWSIYVTMELRNCVAHNFFIVYEDIDSTDLNEICDAHPEKIFKFSKQGFHSEKEAKKFLNRIKVGDIATMVVSNEAMLNYIRGIGALIKLDEIKKE